MAKLESKNGNHIDVSAMLSGNVHLFDTKTIHKIMDEVLKETYLETANDTSLQECKTINDAVACTASTFRQTVLEKLKEKF